MATQTPKLTIVIPTFQAGKTLQASLDSVLGQDFPDWEVLIMDGGSTDNTLSLAREFAARDPRIRVLAEPDKGVYDAMNKGIRAARGEWLYFLGSDDQLHDGKVLGDVFGRQDQNDFDLLYGDVVSPSYKGPYDGVFDFPKLLSRNLSHQAAFYRTSLFRRLGDYDLRFKAYSDWEFNIRCFADSAIRTHYIPRIIAIFGAEGLSSRHDVPFLRDVLFPARLKWLERTGPRALRPIALYDEWWRLLRNAGLRGPAALREKAGREIPTPINDMGRWQQHIPPRLLKMGICSKLCMFGSYVRHRLTGTI